MLDINLFREQPDLIRAALRKRQMQTSPVDQVIELDELRRTRIQEVEDLRAERNLVSKEIGKMKDASERQAKIQKMRQVGERIDQLDAELDQIEAQLDELINQIPNIP